MIFTLRDVVISGVVLFPMVIAYTYLVQFLLNWILPAILVGKVSLFETGGILVLVTLLVFGPVIIVYPWSRISIFINKSLIYLFY